MRGTGRPESRSSIQLSVERVFRRDLEDQGRLFRELSGLDTHWQQEMKHWLFKSEPDAFSIDDLRAMKGKRDHWDGIRNYQARNLMRDQMKKGDLGFFYHSSCKVPGIVGVVQVVKEAYPDYTAWDPESSYYDSRSSPENPRWLMVDVKFVKKYNDVLSLQLLRQVAELEDMVLLQKGSRLSIQPVSEAQWAIIEAMS